jgi:tetratricopeptide (TPR) repeat protein
VSVVIILLNPSGDFEGFLAAARVNPDPIRLLWKRLATSEQRSRMEDFVPIEYNSVELDEEGFLYATTAAVDADVVIAEVNAGKGSEEGAVVRRLNMLGQDILRRNGYFPQVGDVEDLQSKEPFFSGVSKIMDVAAGENGVYYLLDNNRKRVFAYDQDGYLLYAFSGPGQSQGGFHTPTALAVRGGILAVSDRGSNMITVFRRTAYGEAISAAIAAYAAGDYAGSEAAWEQVKSMNANMDMAYAGMGKAAYRSGDYKRAMEYFRTAALKEWYDKAFEEYRRGVLKVWFAPGVLAIIGVFLAVKVSKRLRRKKGAAL